MDGSDEEVDDPPEGDSDEDLSYHRKQIQEEVHISSSQHPNFFLLFCLPFVLNPCFPILQLEGSVDEESTKSDEEYDDLAMEDGQDNGYLSEYEEPSSSNKPFSKDQSPHGCCKYGQNLNLFLRAKSASMSKLPRSNSSINNKTEKRTSPPATNRTRRRSLSIPSFSKDGSYFSGLSLSLAAQR